MISVSSPFQQFFVVIFSLSDIFWFRLWFILFVFFGSLCYHFGGQAPPQMSPALQSQIVTILMEVTSVRVLGCVLFLLNLMCSIFSIYIVLTVVYRRVRCYVLLSQARDKNVPIRRLHSLMKANPAMDLSEELQSVSVPFRRLILDTIAKLGQFC